MSDQVGNSEQRNHPSSLVLQSRANFVVWWIFSGNLCFPKPVPKRCGGAFNSTSGFTARILSVSILAVKSSAGTISPTSARDTTSALRYQRCLCVHCTLGDNLIDCVIHEQVLRTLGHSKHHRLHMYTSAPRSVHQGEEVGKSWCFDLMYHCGKFLNLCL